MKQEGNPGPELVLVLHAAAHGDGAAWTRVVALYGRRVYALAKSRCHNHDVAEEITQSVFATLAAKLGGGEYKEQGRFESWLFRMAMNRIRDHVRRERRRPEELEITSFDQPAGGSADPRSSGTDTTDLECLRRAMGRLAETDRNVIELRHHGQMSFKDMAELLEEPMGTLLARHHRALRKLKELMGGEEQAADRTIRREIQA